MIFGPHFMTLIKVFLNGMGKKMWILEHTIRRKWNSKVLPLVNIIFKKYEEKDQNFNPEKYLEDDQEKYFELLKIWKIKNEKTYFEKY